MCSKTAAHGYATVCSDVRPECHAPSGYSVRDFSGANGARDRQRDMILAYWEACGVARWQGDIANGGGSRWYVRDLVNGGDAWLPIARQGEDSRADRAEFSHVRSTENGGAWCACNLLPESGATNAARGSRDVSDLSDEAAALLNAWPAWWAEHVARPASLKRLKARQSA